jgi:hypothetical protein
MADDPHTRFARSEFLTTVFLVIAGLEVLAAGALLVAFIVDSIRRANLPHWKSGELLVPVIPATPPELCALALLLLWLCRRRQAIRPAVIAVYSCE